MTFSATYSKWGHFFGLYLGFDNRDNVFTNANLTGQVTGQLWNTQGDDAQRKYDYTYDNAGRLTDAAFKEKQHTGDAWSNATMDFSISGTSGKITYDLNGNLLNMLHKGVVPGTVAPITVDNLSYTYSAYSNKLLSVTDNMTSTSVNGLFGDFKDGTNGATPDYVYDANGNLVIDLNKNAKDLANVVGANGIKYNFLDKPEEIRIAGKGTIKITYSASGEKLQRKFISETGDITKITTYINQYIYEESTTIAGAVISPFALGSINFEEGRIRIITPTAQGNGLDALTVDGNMNLPGGKRGAYDYFVMDYQQNVRMILTEEIHSASNTATMETSRATVEESIFGQVGGANEVATTRYATSSTSWAGNTTAQVSRTGTLSGHNIGPNTLQKVMSGDIVNATVQYYHQGAAGGNSNTMVNTVLGSLVQAITGGVGTSNIVKGNATQISNQLSGVNGFINAVQPGGSNPAGNVPQAFLTAIFFDERFNMVPAADGGVVQQQVAATVGSNGATLTLNPVNYKAPKNGYVYIYVSNQSNNDVYFDNLQAGIVQGNIAEENHYYAYGLKIAGLSSKKLGDVYEGSLKNNYLYQGAYSELDEDIGWNDFFLRNYDAQIGRFVQQDPYQEFASPYVGMGTDPVNLTDPSGGSTLPYQAIKLGGEMSQTAATAITLGEVVLTASKATTVAVKGGSLLLDIANITVKAFQVAGLINTSFNTQPPGTPFSRGFKDAYVNATFGGIHDALFGTNLWDYEDANDKIEYLKGRQAGDAAAIVQSAMVTDAGISGGISTSATGVGVVAGTLTAGYGAWMGAVAASDAVWSTRMIAKVQRWSAMEDGAMEKAMSDSKQQPDWFKKEKAKEKADMGLPSLDATGKVHGELPKPKDFGKYSEGALRKLYKELKQSVKKRIEVTTKMGRDRGHGQRQGAEQGLIQSLEKYLSK